jgi:hypothetical protein
VLGHQLVDRIGIEQLRRPAGRKIISWGQQRLLSPVLTREFITVDSNEPSEDGVLTESSGHWLPGLVLARHTDRFWSRSAAGTAIGATVCSAIRSTVSAAVGPTVGSTIRSAIRAAVGPTIRSTIRTAVGRTIRSTIRTAVGATVSSTGTTDAESSGIGTTVSAAIPDTGDAVGTTIGRTLFGDAPAGTPRRLAH